MKTAIFIEDGREQLVLTPETDLEKLVLSKIEDGLRDMSIRKGSFYRCEGGWTRQGTVHGDQSTILVLDATPPTDPARGDR